MKFITKIFSLAITAVTLFMYKKETFAATSLPNSASCTGWCVGYPCSDISTVYCPTGTYGANCSNVCPEGGEINYKYTQTISCGPMGSINSYGVDIWGNFTYSYTGGSVNSCYIPIGRTMSDSTGNYNYTSSCYYSG